MKLLSDLIYKELKTIYDTYRWQSSDGKHVLIAECVYWGDEKRQDQFKITQLFENEIVDGELQTFQTHSIDINVVCLKSTFQTHYIDLVDKWLKGFAEEKIEMIQF